MYKARKLLKSDDSEIPISLMISMIHRTRMIYVNDRMKDIDITAGQIPFLMLLSQEEGVSQDDLAYHFHMDKGTVARALRKMEDNKYLYREIDPKNRRKHLIYLTEKGKETVPQIGEIDKDWEDLLSSKISEDEYNRLSSILKTMALNCLQKVDKNGEK